ncbi:MAG: Ig-like domain-containing protein, partial [Gemmatimonadaceae bacterium]
MVAAVVAGCVLAGAEAARAATITVNTTQDAQPSPSQCRQVANDCALRQAIDAAANGDVVLLPAGSYAVTLGEVPVNVSVTIMGSVGAPGTVTVSAGGNSRIFNIGSVAFGVPVSIQGLTLSAGQARDGEASGDAGANGGAILNLGTLSMSNSVVTGSRAGDGAGGTGSANGGAGGDGGAIWSLGGLVIQSTTFASNRAGDGGNGGTPSGISQSGGGNGAVGGDGGAIWSAGATTILGSTFTGNDAGSGGNGGDGASGLWGGGAGGVGADGGDGGALWVGGLLGISETALSVNDAGGGGEGGEGGNAIEQGSPGSGGSGGEGGDGGGFYATDPTSVVQSSTSGNQAGGGGDGGESGGGTPLGTAGGAGGSGGGIAIAGDLGDLTVVQSTISGNDAGSGAVGGSGPGTSSGVGGAGGGIWGSGAITVVNSTLTGNVAGHAALEFGVEPSGSPGNGGGIYASDGLLLVSSTVAGNSGGQLGQCFEDCPSGSRGGGVYGAAGTTILRNSLFAANTVSANGGGANCDGTVTDGGGNLVFPGNSGCPAGFSNQDPKLDPQGLADNGGPTETIALEGGSAAVNAVPVAQCTSQEGDPLTLDQRGLRRPVGDACDIGAFESQVACEALTLATDFNQAVQTTLDCTGTGGAVSYAIVQGPANGQLSGLDPATGALTYTPDTNFAGTDSFVYAGTESAGDTGTGTVTITVAQPPPPTCEDTSASMSYAQVAQFVDLSCTGLGTLNYTVVSGPAHGNLSSFGDPTQLQYNVDFGFVGTDSFTYKATNEGGDSNVATATITRTPPAVPTCNELPAQTFHGQQVAVELACQGPAPLTYAIAEQPEHGELSGLDPSAGTVTYTPEAGFTGTDSFAYAASNPGGPSAPAIVTVMVLPAAPSCEDASVSATSGQTFQVELDCSEPVTFGYFLIDGPAHGRASLVDPEDGTLAYTSNPRFVGSDSVSFRASNAGGSSNVATLTIEVALPSNAFQIGKLTRNPRAGTGRLRLQLPG